MVPNLYVISVVNYTKQWEDLYDCLGILESLIQVSQQILISNGLNGSIACDSQNNMTAVMGSELVGFRKEKYLVRFRKILQFGFD